MPLMLASRWYLKLAIIVAVIVTTVFFFSKIGVIIRWRPRQETVLVTFVSCGGGIEESVVMMKSMILFSKAHIVYHIFTEVAYMDQYKAVLKTWPKEVTERVEFILHEVSFPETTNADVGEWMKLCKPCSSQRLFIHELLPEVDAILYVDTDTLFLAPVEELWQHIGRFNKDQLAGLAPEQERGEAGFYDRNPEIPHYGDKGVNAGVMLMNLTRIRASTWLQEIVANFGKYKDILKLGDQDLLNIYFHRFPELLYVFPCVWNYRAEHCNKTSTCRRVEATGARLIHGMSEVWFTNDQPAFKALYETFEKHPITAPSTVSVLSSIYNSIKKAPPSNCGAVMDRFVWNMLNNAIDDFSPLVTV